MATGKKLFRDHLVGISGKPKSDIPDWEDDPMGTEDQVSVIMKGDVYKEAGLKRSNFKELEGELYDELCKKHFDKCRDDVRRLAWSIAKKKKETKFRPTVKWLDDFMKRFSLSKKRTGILKLMKNLSKNSEENNTSNDDLESTLFDSSTDDFQLDTTTSPIRKISEDIEKDNQSSNKSNGTRDDKEKNHSEKENETKSSSRNEKEISEKSDTSSNNDHKANNSDSIDKENDNCTKKEEQNDSKSDKSKNTSKEDVEDSKTNSGPKRAILASKPKIKGRGAKILSKFQKRYSSDSADKKESDSSMNSDDIIQATPDKVISGKDNSNTVSKDKNKSESDSSKDKNKSESNSSKDKNKSESNSSKDKNKSESDSSKDKNKSESDSSKDKLITPIKSKNSTKPSDDKKGSNEDDVRSRLSPIILDERDHKSDSDEAMEVDAGKNSVESDSLIILDDSDEDQEDRNIKKVSSNGVTKSKENKTDSKNKKMSDEKETKADNEESIDMKSDEEVEKSDREENKSDEEKDDSNLDKNVDKLDEKSKEKEKKPAFGMIRLKNLSDLMTSSADKSSNNKIDKKEKKKKNESSDDEKEEKDEEEEEEEEVEEDDDDDKSEEDEKSTETTSEGSRSESESTSSSDAEKGGIDFERWKKENTCDYSEKEAKHYEKHLLDIKEKVDDKMIRCTACNEQVNHLTWKMVYTHPALGVLVCKKCRKFYNRGKFPKDEDGSDEYCRWCANGGDLLLCDACSNGICKGCVKRNFGRSGLSEAVRAKKYFCYECDKKPLQEFRDIQHYIMENLVEKKSHEKDKSRREKTKSSLKDRFHALRMRRTEKAKEIESAKRKKKTNEATKKTKDKKSDSDIKSDSNPSNSTESNTFILNSIFEMQEMINTCSGLLDKIKSKQKENGDNPDILNQSCRRFVKLAKGMSHNFQELEVKFVKDLEKFNVCLESPTKIPIKKEEDNKSEVKRNILPEISTNKIEESSSKVKEKEGDKKEEEDKKEEDKKEGEDKPNLRSKLSLRRDRNSKKVEENCGSEDNEPSSHEKELVGADNSDNNDEDEDSKGEDTIDNSPSKRSLRKRNVACDEEKTKEKGRQTRSKVKEVSSEEEILPKTRNSKESLKKKSKIIDNSSNEISSDDKNKESELDDEESSKALKKKSKLDQDSSNKKEKSKEVVASDSDEDCDPIPGSPMISDDDSSLPFTSTPLEKNDDSNDDKNNSKKLPSGSKKSEDKKAKDKILDSDSEVEINDKTDMDKEGKENEKKSELETSQEDETPIPRTLRNRQSKSDNTEDQLSKDSSDKKSRKNVTESPEKPKPRSLRSRKSTISEDESSSENKNDVEATETKKEKSSKNQSPNKSRKDEDSNPNENICENDETLENKEMEKSKNLFSDSDNNSDVSLPGLGMNQSGGEQSDKENTESMPKQEEKEDEKSIKTTRRSSRNNPSKNEDVSDSKVKDETKLKDKIKKDTKEEECEEKSSIVKEDKSDNEKTKKRKLSNSSPSKPQTKKKCETNGETRSSSRNKISKCPADNSESESEIDEKVGNSFAKALLLASGSEADDDETQSEPETIKKSKPKQKRCVKKTNLGCPKSVKEARQKVQLDKECVVYVNSFPELVQRLLQEDGGLDVTEFPSIYKSKKGKNKKNKSTNNDDNSEDDDDDDEEFKGLMRFSLTAAKKKSKEEQSDEDDDELSKTENTDEEEEKDKKSKRGRKKKEDTLDDPDKVPSKKEKKEGLLDISLGNEEDQDDEDDNQDPLSSQKKKKTGFTFNEKMKKNLLLSDSDNDDGSETDEEKALEISNQNFEDGLERYERRKLKKKQEEEKKKQEDDDGKKDENNKEDEEEEENKDNEEEELEAKKSKYRKGYMSLKFSSSEDDDKENDADDDDDQEDDTDTESPRKKRMFIASDSSSDEGRRKRKKKQSDTSDSDFEEELKDDKAKPKRRRIQKRSTSSEDEEDGGEKDNEGANEEGKDSPSKKIRRIIRDEDLAESTKNANQEEQDRRERIKQRQKEYNRIFEINVETDQQELGKLVLDFDPDSKKELVSVHPKLVAFLKPHQFKGIKFMWDATFESVERLDKGETGGGCILAHCMGLGKTLQVIVYLHTLLTNKIVKRHVSRVMVCCPVNTIFNWVAEFSNWLKGRLRPFDVIELNSCKDLWNRAYRLDDWYKEGGVLIMGYDMFRNLSNEKNKRYKGRMKEIFQRTLVYPGPDVVICDEGHILKNEKSAISVGINRVNTLRRVVLTGTPLQNNLKEYHCMIQFVKPNILGTKKEFMNRFVNPIDAGQCVNAQQRDVKRMKRRAHILHNLLEGVVQRYDYTVLKPFLPPKLEYVVAVQLSELQIKLYRHYLNNLAQGGPKRMGSGLFVDFNNLSRIWTHPKVLELNLRRAQMSQDYEEEMDDFIDDETTSDESSDSDSTSKKKKKNTKKDKDKEDSDEKGKDDNVVALKETESRIPGLTETGKVRPDWWTYITNNERKEGDDEYEIFDVIENSGKLVLLLEILRECSSIGDKVLVFTQSIHTLDMIEDFLAMIDNGTLEMPTNDDSLPLLYTKWKKEKDYLRLDGSVGADTRKSDCNYFNNEKNDRCRLFLISTKAGGLGINLVAANRVIIFDSCWNPSLDTQSIFRVYRFGQRKPCYVYRFIAQGTMEEKIYSRQVAKLSTAQRVVDEHQIKRYFDMAELSELYEFNPADPDKRDVPNVPEDRLLADMLIRQKQWIVGYHEHDSLLENQTEESLTEEERKAAWEDFENEKKMPAVRATNMTNNFNLPSAIPPFDAMTVLETIRQQNPDFNNQQVHDGFVMATRQIQKVHLGHYTRLQGIIYNMKNPMIAPEIKKQYNIPLEENVLPNLEAQIKVLEMNIQRENQVINSYTKQRQMPFNNVALQSMKRAGRGGHGGPGVSNYVNINRNVQNRRPQGPSNDAEVVTLE